ncbi:MAG TPA: hypothetical protein PLK35_00730 [Candidatus Moranbacteria bacterium]|nr:hypothetical protein [Candidatus Moranbacteria bacterium]
MYKNKTNKTEEKKEPGDQREEMISQMFHVEKKEKSPEEAEYIKRCNETTDDMG